MPLSITPCIDLIYEGVLDDKHWRKLLQSINRELPASTACMIVESADVPEAPSIFYEGGEQGSVDLYQASMYSSDPFTNLPKGRVVSIDEVIDFDHWKATDFYRLCVEPPGLRHFIGVDIRFQQYSYLKIRVGRSKTQGVFSGADRTLIGDIAHHLQRAFRIKASLGSFSYQLESQSEALNRLAIGTTVITESLGLVSVNPLARKIFETHPSVGLEAGKLLFRQPAVQREFRAALEQLKTQDLQGLPGTPVFLKLPATGTAESLGIAIRPLDRAGKEIACNNTLHFGLYIRALKPSGNADQSALQALFGLTPKESHLSLLIAEGYSLDEAADVLGIRLNTARAHLRAIFLKTGVSRQSQLVSTITGSVAGF